MTAVIGNNCTIKNSIILNNVYIGDNSYIENCIVESRDTIKANTRYVGENGDTIKYNMKPQTLLVDFDPYRLFSLQEQKSMIYNRLRIG